MIKSRTIPALVGMLLCTLALRAQTGSEDPRDTYQLHIKRASSPIVLDGLMGEMAWEEAEVARDFWLKFPRDGEPAPKRTEVRMTYDDRFLYVIAVCYGPDNYVVQTLKRDSRFFDGDAFGVILDPMNRRTNGFLFGVSPYNVQAEDLLSSARVAIENGRYDEAEAAYSRLQLLLSQLKSSYRLRVVSEPDKKSGVWRIPDINSNARNYYLIVQAIDDSGKVLTMPDQRARPIVSGTVSMPSPSWMLAGSFSQS